jgi:hypothetical protein
MWAKNDRLIKRFRALRHANGGDRQVGVRYSAENVCAGGDHYGFYYRITFGSKTYVPLCIPNERRIVSIAQMRIHRTAALRQSKQRKGNGRQ